MLFNFLCNTVTRHITYIYIYKTFFPLFSLQYICIKFFSSSHPIKCNSHEGRDGSCTDQLLCSFPWDNARHSRHSINICLMNTWMDSFLFTPQSAVSQAANFPMEGAQQTSRNAIEMNSSGQLCESSVCEHLNGLTRRQWVKTPPWKSSRTVPLWWLQEEERVENCPYPYERKPVRCTHFLCISGAVI